LDNHSADPNKVNNPPPVNPRDPHAAAPRDPAPRPLDDGVHPGSEEAEASPGAWLVQNAVIFLIVLSLFVWAYTSGGLEGVWTWTKVGLGLGLVIFIHELGHFLVAKWCAVHVQTFSIGFGPALPGCRFQWGETTYKLAVFPLGGYVKMVGEGEDSEEDEEDPRSFKNKTVWQRMAIISAGVVMNVVLGFVLFITVFMSHGDKRTPGVVGRVEPGGPVWRSGVPTGSVIKQIGSLEDPSFDDLLPEVGLSAEGRKLPFVVVTPEGKRLSTEIEPRLAKGDRRPVIGLMTPAEPRLVPQRGAQKRLRPVGYSSAAAKAREVPLKPGDRVVATTDPDRPDEPGAMLDLKPVTGQDYDFKEFNRRLELLAGKPMTVLVQRRERGAEIPPEAIRLPAQGFQFDDQIIGTTDPEGTPFNPHVVKELAKDPYDADKGYYDYFDFQRRMRLLAGNPIIVQVRRHGASRDADPVSVWVPPEYHYTFKGLRMRMGKVAGLRQRSPGATAEVIRGDKETYGPGIKPGDRIDQVEVKEADGKIVRFVAARNSKPAGGAAEKDLDPVRLPFELKQWADRQQKASVQQLKVRLTVRRANPRTHNADDTVTLEAAWDDAWRFDDAVPYSPSAPMALSELGIAYYVDSTIEEATPESPAAAEDLQKHDRIKAVKFFKPKKAPEDPEETVKDWLKLKSEESDATEEYNHWANVDWEMQHDSVDVRKLVLLVDREGKEREVTLTAEPDPTWPEADRGWLLMGQKRLRKAESLAQAAAWGTKRTTDSIYYIYLGLLRMITGRLSFVDNTIGPLRIAEAAYTLAGEDFADFLIFLAIISVNLAVINFLPIPVLDGGHMVFLVYEKLRGKPASEQVRIVATYVGLALIVSLMLVVIFLDVKHWL